MIFRYVNYISTGQDAKRNKEKDLPSEHPYSRWLTDTQKSQETTIIVYSLCARHSALDLMGQVLLPVRLREVKQLAQGHTAKKKWCSQGAHPNPPGTTTWPLNCWFFA